MNTLGQNLRYALRQLRRSPGFTAVAVLSLGLGIGANAGIFSLFEQILLRPLAVPEPARLVNLAAPGPKPGSQSCGQAGDCDVVFSYPMFRDLESAQEPFTGIAAHRFFGANLATGDQTLSGSGVFVSGSYFPVLGLNPTLGRLLGPDDDRDIGAHPVAVLSHRFWESRLGADADVLDRTFMVNGHALTIVGVAPRGFDGVTLGSQPDIFVPVTMRGVLTGDAASFEDRKSYWVYLFARLEPGVSMEQARDAMNRLYSPIINEVESPLQTQITTETLAMFRAKEIALEPGWRGQSTFHDDARTPLFLLFGVTGIVLLITCANIANLLLARGAGRAQELAVRTSLGASRGRLVGQLVTEALVLAAAGGVASLIAAQWTLSGIGAFLPPEMSGFLELELRRPTLYFAVALALGTGLVFGLYPAIHATRHGLMGTLRTNAAQSAGGRSASRFRVGLVTAQIALSMALLISAGLFVRSLMNVSRVDLGLNPVNVIAFDVHPGLNGYSPEASRAFFERAEAELAAIPGVSAVSTARIAILRGNNWGNDLSVEGFDSGPGTDANARYNQVGPGYFRTLGIPLLAGREFTEADAGSPARVAIVNEAFARKFGLDPRETVGKRMAFGREQTDLDIEIVGMVRDASYNDVKQDAPPMFATPWRQHSVGGLTFYLRSEVDPSTALAAVPGVIRRLDANLPVENLVTMERQVRENVFVDRMIGTLTVAFAALATLMAALGLFGILAYTVAQRRREIGLRMALGAGRGRIRAMVLRQVGVMALIGGAIGIAGAIGLGHAASSLLFGVVGHDPVAVLAGALLLTAVALIAAYLPARRASRIEPMVALRTD